MRLIRRGPLAAMVFVTAACHPDFQITKFPTNEALYRAAMQEAAAQRWDNAVAAFEKLTTDLSARDTLLPRAHWFLGRAHEARGEHVLAATSFSHLVENFPDDTLAAPAALAAARAYGKMWRKPALDPTYGETALATYNTLLSLYPQSPLVPEAKKELAELEEMFAQKAYLTGLYYLRRGAYDSGIIYFKDVLAKWPASPTSRSAQLRLVESYRAIRYREDAQDQCAALRKNYPGDAEVRLVCQGVGEPAQSAPAATSNAPPASTGPPQAATPPSTPPAD